MSAYPSNADRCPRCRSWFKERAYPRKVRVDDGGRDAARVACLAVEDEVVWVPKYLCDCLWRAQVRGVAHDLVELLLPDPAAQAAIRRRGVTRTQEAA